VGNVANRAIAAAKGPVQACAVPARPTTSCATCATACGTRREEIAHYNVIEAAAEELGDRDYGQARRTYRRQEEDMHEASSSARSLR
jgi:hypothetical protein